MSHIQKLEVIIPEGIVNEVAKITIFILYVKIILSHKAQAIKKVHQIDFVQGFVENGAKGGLSMSYKQACRREEVRNQIKFIFRMKIAVHFCMVAHIIGLENGNRRSETSVDEEWGGRVEGNGVGIN